MYKFTILWTSILRNILKVGSGIWTHDFVHTSQLPWPLRYQHEYSHSKAECIVDWFTWGLVTHVRRRTKSAPRPSHHDDVAGPSIAGPGEWPRECSGWPAFQILALHQLAYLELTSSVVPSQTVGQQLRCHKIAIANHNKTNSVGRYLNQNLWHKKNGRVGLCKRMSKVLPPIPGKGCHFVLSSVSGCRILIDFLLLGYFCQSINLLDIALCCIKCPHQIDHLNQLNHYNNLQEM
jgi:hypothetical protein